MLRVRVVSLRNPDSLLAQGGSRKRAAFFVRRASEKADFWAEDGMNEAVEGMNGHGRPLQMVSGKA
jgi:hypothetical protein